MKRTLFFLFLSLAANVLSAAPRTPEQAVSLAQRVMARRAPSRQPVEAASCAVIRQTDAYYAINAGNGFVVVSADDTMPEILGFSFSGALDTAQMPPALSAWLDDYDTNQVYMRATGDACAPLVPCQWNQSAPFNDMTPMYDATHHCVTGCTATAMAQLMYTHRHPVQGTGSHSYFWTCAENPAYSAELSADFGNTTYNWDAMLPHYTASYTPEQAQAVAELMKHCGVAIEMQYGSGGSSGSDIDLLQGLMNYFGYDHNILVLRKSLCEIDDLAGQMRDELRAGRPVYMSGRGSGGGHAFICDGFDADGYFHINWGWGGLGDGYYLLTGLQPTQQGVGGNLSGDYNSDVTVAIGIRPATGATDTVFQMSVGQIELAQEQAGRNGVVGVTLRTVKNEGLHDFKGQYNIGLLGENTDEVQAVVASPSTSSLPAGHFFTTPMRFSCSFSDAIPNGTYRLCGVFRKAGSDEWQVMSEAGGRHRTHVTISTAEITLRAEEEESPVELSADSITCDRASLARDGKWAATAWKVINTGTETFTGQLGVVLLDGNTNEIISVLAVHSASMNLPPNYYFTDPITIQNVSVPAEIPAGSYKLAFAHHHVYSRWTLVQLFRGSSGKILLPVQITDSQILFSDKQESVENVLTDKELLLDSRAVIYTLSGRRVQAADNLPPGAYIVCRDGECRKLVLEY